MSDRLEITGLLVSALSSVAAKSNSKRLNPRREQQIPIIACSSTTELQRAISFYIHPNDRVLEFGAQLSDASLKLCKTIGPGGQAVLVDVKRSDTKSGRSSTRDTTPFIQQEPSDNDRGDNGNDSFIDTVSFVELDQFDQWRSVLFRENGLATNSTFNAMILDLSAMTGNDLPLTSLTLSDQLAAHIQNGMGQSSNSSALRVILIKSKSLSKLAKRLVHAQRLLDGSIVLALRDRSHEPCIIASVGVDEYRRTIPYTVQKGESVLEVGCHFGRTTRILHDAAIRISDQDREELGYTGIRTHGGCIGVDIGPKIIASAKKQYPEIPFAVGDAWRTLDLIKMKDKLLPVGKKNLSSLGYDVVYADIGGLSGPAALLESLSLLDSLGAGLEPRFIVIKSLCMKRLSSRLRAFSDVWSTIQH